MPKYQIVDPSRDWRQHQRVSILNGRPLEQTRVMSIIRVTLTSHPIQRTRVMSIIGVTLTFHPISDPRHEHHWGHPNLDESDKAPRYQSVKVSNCRLIP